MTFPADARGQELGKGADRDPSPRSPRPDPCVVLLPAARALVHFGRDAAQSLKSLQLYVGRHANTHSLAARLRRAGAAELHVRPRVLRPASTAARVGACARSSAHQSSHRFPTLSCKPPALRYKTVTRRRPGGECAARPFFEHFVCSSEPFGRPRHASSARLWRVRSAAPCPAARLLKGSSLATVG